MWIGYLALIADKTAEQTSDSEWTSVAIWTAVVAGLGFVVALGGLVLSIINAVASYRRAYPPIKWSQRWDYGNSSVEDVLTDGVRFFLDNRGEGIARDVKVRVPNMAGEMQIVEQADEVKFGEPIAVWLALDDEPVHLLIDNKGTTVERSVGGWPFGGTLRVEVEWSRAPKLHKRRKKVWRYKKSLVQKS